MNDELVFWFNREKIQPKKAEDITANSGVRRNNNKILLPKSHRCMKCTCEGKSQKTRNE